MVLRGRAWTFLLGLGGLLLAGGAQAFDEATANRVLSFARQQAPRTDAVVGQAYPQSTQDSTWRTFSAGDEIAWTQGFFPGELWYLAEDSDDANLRSRASARTGPLQVQQNNSRTHDTGFKLMTSFGNAYRMTGNDAQRQVLLTGAGSLARRYNARLGYVVCCDWNYPTWRAPLVVDTMMNIELLLWGAAHGGQAAWRDMAISHALKTRDLLVRADGSSWQVVDFDPNTGVQRLRGTYQGASDDSTWARGQTWLMYGYTMVYRYTRDARMLAAAEKTSDWYVNHLPADSVPLWDFNAPDNKQFKDTSAAAIAASALLELSGYTADPARRQRYQEVALRTLDALSSPEYLVASGVARKSVLQKGVGNGRTMQEVGVGLSYGDYYFVEAVLRFKRQTRLAAGWGGRLDFAAGVHALTPPATGSVTVEFDVTPRRYPLDDVIGYAGSATPITGFSSLAMLIRMNPAGRFDVRNGATYAALAAVPYAPDTTYHVRMQVDLNARRYSVWVRPPGGAEVQIASNYAFRSDAPVPTDLGQVVLKSTVADDAYTVTHHTVRPAGEVWSSRVNFPESVHSLGPGNTGVRTVEFDVTPARNLFDGVIGYADSSTTVTGFNSSAMLIRMNTNGRFDVRNGGAYAALTAVPYSAGNTYHVRMQTDLNARRYSVWVRPPGGVEIQIASNYAFRSDAPPTDDLGQVSVSGTTGNDTYTVRNHTVRAGTLTVPRARRAPSDR